jgi:hypothetical protein
MADETQVFAGFDLSQAWPFTQLFRAFRIAIHPSKLALGLALLLSIFAGGEILDALWPPRSRAVANEPVLFQEAAGQAEFETARSALAGSEGLFHAFSDYEAHEFTGVVRGVLANEWFENPESPGVPGHIYNFAVMGPLWLAREHAVFAIFFAVLFLAAWSLFGGAIARLAAVHVARRDDKVSIRQALNFSLGKFFSFVSAPIIPLLIVAGVGLLTAVCSLLGSIPYLGPIIVGAAFLFALLGAFVQTLVILGAVGGFNLMYPTVAVEGTDSFDAISRSFSYVYARPWRMLFYTAVSVAYGALTYLFVRLFILLMLVLAHHFVAMGVYQCDARGMPLLPSMWPSPAATGRLIYTVDYSALNWGQAIGAALLSFWIYLIIGILGAFAISFYFSANTIIYYLMRQKLDATEMDDVYLEQTEEEFVTGGEAVVVQEEVSTVPVEAPPSGPPAAGA